jgi:hypothetical protein
MSLKIQVHSLIIFSIFILIIGLSLILSMFTNLFQITVDFVKQNGLAIGDSITLFEDECKNLVSFSSLLHNLLKSEVRLRIEKQVNLSWVDDYNALELFLLCDEYPWEVEKMSYMCGPHCGRIYIYIDKWMHICSIWYN